ncbi:MAG TPA: multicopper oxidase domain-containing protein [Steroidobacteraceae bacterium]|nr:multicopper oxidase domain-containing protein [Steroidobacteraceae bacterium]
MRRRGFLQLAASACVLGGSACRPRPEKRLLPSLAPLPKPFTATLPLPPVAKTVRSDDTTDFYEIDVAPAAARILPGLDTPIWGYGGTFPGPTFQARRGRRVSLLLHNRLPVPIVNHLHGGHTAPESDGYPTDLILPETGFPAMHSHDPQARIVRGEREFVYDNDQRAATLWYHDHRMDFTAPQIWRGLAGFYLIRDEEEERLPLPSGGREIPLLLCDRSFNADGSLRYPALDPSLRHTPGTTPEYAGGVLGDVILVNGAPWPRLEVAAVKYRFRILNASNARRYELAFDPPPSGGAAFVQIGSDGGLLAAPVPHQTLRIAPAERFDVVIDFSRFRPGASATLLNQAGSGNTARVMRFDITRTEPDDSSIPDRLSDVPPPNPREAAVTREFDFACPRLHSGWTINGQFFDPSRIDAQVPLDSTEIWRLKTDFSHPLHLHLTHFRVLSHSGRPGPYDSGWKDTIDLGPGQAAEILVRFTGHRGRYVFHCHNLEHEDMGMMGNFEVV